VREDSQAGFGHRLNHDVPVRCHAEGEKSPLSNIPSDFSTADGITPQGFRVTEPEPDTSESARPAW
jgi:hypothetical protein